MKTYGHFLITVLLLGATAVVLQARDRNEIIPSRPALSSFPQTLGGWTGSDDAIGQDVRDVLGPGDFMLRTYQDPAQRSSIDLFVAYFPTQRTGDTIHSPKNCLPGSGWTPVSADRITIDVPGHAPFPANRYLIAKGQNRDLVLYWYWAHDRGVASEYSAKFYLVADSIRLHRTDGSLFRINTRIEPNKDLNSAQDELLSFAKTLVPLIDTYIPR